MYIEAYGKKVFEPLTTSRADLDFTSSAGPSPAPDALEALGAINWYTPVTIEDVDHQGTSFYLESSDLEDSQLFSLLRTHWADIIGRHTLKFALIYYLAGPDAGIWLERVGENIPPGCHQIYS